jgi:predicted transcriptional regulator
MPTTSRPVRLSKCDDGGVLLDVEQGAIFSLNSVGARIVELLQAQQATASIVSQISREFGVSEQVVSGDVADFLRLLHERGLLESPSQASHDSKI